MRSAHYRVVVMWESVDFEGTYAHAPRQTRAHNTMSERAVA
jgi:hypothetical protein